MEQQFYLFIKEIVSQIIFVIEMSERIEFLQEFRRIITLIAFTLVLFILYKRFDDICRDIIARLVKSACSPEEMAFYQFLDIGLISQQTDIPAIHETSDVVDGSFSARCLIFNE